MVSLLDTVAAASDFSKFVGKWTGEIGREDSDQLVAVGHFSCQLIVEEGTREIEVAKEVLVEAVTVRGIGEVGAKDEGTVWSGKWRKDGERGRLSYRCLC